MEPLQPPYDWMKGKDLGVKTWPADHWQHGGGTFWGWISYDPELDLIFYGTANPGPWNPAERPGDNLWTTTIFARDPDTGMAKWAYQTTPHDLWGGHRRRRRLLRHDGPLVQGGERQDRRGAVAVPRAVGLHRPTRNLPGDGRQYVAILSGIGGWSGAVAAAEIDPRVRNGALGFVGATQDLPAYTLGGSTLLVFALPQPREQTAAAPAPAPAAEQLIEKLGAAAKTQPEADRAPSD